VPPCILTFVTRPDRTPSIAETVAAQLRGRILSGDLDDGALLPTQELLLAEFAVSKPSLREALRILETEGLVTVQRGAIGGARVHRPKAENAGYMLGLVLEARSAGLDDVGAALCQLEPVCARLCAERPDRADTAVAALRKAHEASIDAAAVGDNVVITATARAFHEILVNECGNETMIVMIGALEELWSTHEQAWAVDAQDSGSFPDRSHLHRSLDDHARLIDAIEAGDADAAARLAREHLERTVFLEVARRANTAVAVSSHLRGAAARRDEASEHVS
jgi:GntR family transcriptional repressor for pyruvate dehydrogenase complex